MRRPLRAGIIPALLLGIALQSPARAAESPPDTAIVPIEGVTITGSRAPETVLRTPAAVTLVQKERLAPTRQISLADGLSMTPGVFTQSRSGAQDVRITIRGYGARGNGERSNTGNMRGIRVQTDGVPLTEPDGRTSLEFVDLGGIEQIEVLRSNGSVLYGNASGGVVNLRTGLDFNSPFADLSFRGGEFDFRRGQAVTGFVAGRARGVVSVFNSDFDGWRDHSGSQTTSIQSRVSTPVDDHSRLGLLMDYVSNLNRYPGALTQAELDADPQQANATFVARDERRINKVGRIAATYNRDLPERQLLTLAAWVEPKALQRSERNRYRDFARYHVGGSATWQVETPLGENSRGLWMAGVDEQFQDGSIQFYDQVNGARGTTLVSNKREGANSFGGFAQGEWRGGDWMVRLAARYDNLWYISEDRIDPTLNASTHFTQVTPKGSIARLFDRNTLYASVGGGVEAPAFNEIDPPPPFDTTTSFNPFLDPMTSVSYEIGAKGRLTAEGARYGALGYDIALYWIDVRNDIVPWDGGAYFLTAGKSRRKGVEVGFDWRPIDVLTLASAVTWSNNEYVEYENELSAATPDGNFNGNEVAGLPAVFLDGEVRWRLLPGLNLAGTVRFVDDYFADDANTARAPSYSLIGALVEYTRPMPFGSLRLFVAGENLADEDHVASVFINGVSDQYFEPGLPRNVSMGISVGLR